MNDKLVQKVSKYAIFNYQENDNCLIDELISYLDSQAERIIRFFDVKLPKDKLAINIIPTKKEYDEMLKKQNNSSEDFVVPKWAIGQYLGNKNCINYLSINDYKNTSHAFREDSYLLAVQYYKKTLVHEFIHYVNKLFNVQNNNCGTSKYLREGIAVYLSGQREKQEIFFDFTLEQLLETDVSKSCYNGYYLVTKFLIENYDKDFVLDLFKSSNKSKKFLEQELYEKAKQYYTGVVI